MGTEEHYTRFLFFSESQILFVLSLAFFMCSDNFNFRAGFHTTA